MDYYAEDPMVLNGNTIKLITAGISEKIPELAHLELWKGDNEELSS